MRPVMEDSVPNAQDGVHQRATETVAEDVRGNDAVLEWRRPNDVAPVVLTAVVKINCVGLPG